jgi:hypothetical protein
MEFSRKWGIQTQLSSHRRTVAVDFKKNPQLYVGVVGALVAFAVTFGVGLVRTLHAEPVPASMQAYVGTWENRRSFLDLSASGTLQAHFTDDHSEFSTNLPVREYAPDALRSEVMFIPVTYRIDVPPHVVADGSTHMTVDGQDLKKLDRAD